MRKSHVGHGGRNVDDTPEFLCDHPRNKSSAAEESAINVRLHHTMPLCERELVQRLAQIDAGVVDQDVGGASRVTHLPGHSGHFVFLAQVRKERVGFAAMAFDFYFY